MENITEYTNGAGKRFCFAQTPIEAGLITLTSTVPMMMTFTTKSGASFIELPEGKWRHLRFIKGAEFTNQRIFEAVCEKSGHGWKDYNTGGKVNTARQSYKSLLEHLNLPYHSQLLQLI